MPPTVWWSCLMRWIEYCTNGVTSGCSAVPLDQSLREGRPLIEQSSDRPRAEDVSGRGIFLTRSFFPSLAYNEHGNEVTFTLSLADL